MKSYVAYKGTRFTIEWYTNDVDKSEVLDYFMQLSDTRKEKALYLFKIMADFGKILNEKKFRHEGDQIYAFKPSPDRFLCFFFKGGKIIITNGFEKKTEKLPTREKAKALKYMKEYIVRLGKQL